MRKILLAVSVLTLFASALVPVMAEAPKVPALAPAADLAKEAEAKIAALETSLASNDSYNQAKKMGIPADAGVLAILAHALANHPESGWKAAADVRDAAIKLGAAGTYDEAKAELEAVKKAVASSTATGKPEHEWNKLAKLGNVMSEVNKRHAKLRLAARKIPEDAEEAARHASVLAILGVVAHADTHEVKKDADKPEWQQMCIEMSESATEAAAALKAKDLAKVKAAFDRNKKSCADCHAKFRDL